MYVCVCMCVYALKRLIRYGQLAAVVIVGAILYDIITFDIQSGEGITAKLLKRYGHALYARCTPVHYTEV